MANEENQSHQTNNSYDELRYYSKPFSFTSIPKNGPNNIPTNNVAIVTAPVLKGLWVVLNIYVIKPSVVAVLPIVEKNRALFKRNEFLFSRFIPSSPRL